jgi:hypothetical protein
MGLLAVLELAGAMAVTGGYAIGFVVIIFV